MCGIVGYIGNQDAYPILIKGLKRLEYRGYDSAGVALLNGDTPIYKKKGKGFRTGRLMLGVKTPKAPSGLAIPDGPPMENPVI